MLTYISEFTVYFIRELRDALSKKNRIGPSFASKGESKVHPRTDRDGPVGEDRYSSTLPLTSALEGDGWSMPRHGRFTPGKDPVHIV